MEATLSQVEIREKIIKAAYWKIPENWLGGSDPNYNAFIEAFTYRKKIAMAYLQEEDDNKKESLIFAFDDCNKNIKEILCL